MMVSIRGMRRRRRKEELVIIRRHEPKRILLPSFTIQYISSQSVSFGGKYIALHSKQEGRERERLTALKRYDVFYHVYM